MSLSRGWWSKAVPIFQKRTGTTLNVNNSMQAARVLLEEWPTSPGPKHRAARQAVLDAMQKAMDKERQAKAQRAFQEAAEEAGIARDGSGDER